MICSRLCQNNDRRSGWFQSPRFQDSRIPGFQGSRVPGFQVPISKVPISKVPRSRAPRFDRVSRSAKFQSSRVPGKPRFQKCKVSKFQGSRVRVAGFLVQVAFTVPGFQKFQGSRSFQSPEVSKFQGSRVRVPRFQGSRVPRFQGYTRRSGVVRKYDLFKALSKQ